jgi:hypothetical protein
LEFFFLEFSKAFPEKKKEIIKSDSTKSQESSRSISQQNSDSNIHTIHNNNNFSGIPKVILHSELEALADSKKMEKKIPGKYQKKTEEKSEKMKFTFEGNWKKFFITFLEKKNSPAAQVSKKISVLQFIAFRHKFITLISI